MQLAKGVILQLHEKIYLQQDLLFAIFLQTNILEVHLNQILLRHETGLRIFFELGNMVSVQSAEYFSTLTTTSIK